MAMAVLEDLQCQGKRPHLFQTFGIGEPDLEEIGLGEGLSIPWFKALENIVEVVGLNHESLRGIPLGT